MCHCDKLKLTTHKGFCRMYKNKHFTQYIIQSAIADELYVVLFGNGVKL